MNTKVLDPQRLFSDPPLAGGEPIDLKFSPDGLFISYRRAAIDDRERMDLWRVDIESGVHREWVNASHLLETKLEVSDLTEQERAERERRRQFTYGVTQYSWHPDGKHLLLPMDGGALLVDVSTTELSTRQLCPAGTRQSGFKLSPDGNQLSYVRNGNLFICNIETLQETQLTNDGSELVCNGLPDFLAAEEMHRFQGHWWSPDGRYIAYCKVDESSVEVSFRLEMQAATAQTVAQRYPYAGAANPLVSLWLYDLKDQASRCIWQDCGVAASLLAGAADDAYLARVHLDEARVLIQTQDRLQQRLRIQSASYTEDGWTLLHSETSETWINLDDDLRILTDGSLLFSSEASGTRALLHLSTDGDAQVVPGPQHINAVVGIDATTVLATGWHSTPLENHLFAISLPTSAAAPEFDASAPKSTPTQAWRQLSHGAGWHEFVLNPHKDAYLARFSDPHTPVRLALHSMDGATPPRDIFAEQIDDTHPYAPYLPNHAYPVFGEIAAKDGQSLYYRLTPPAQINGKHATIVYVYGGPGPQKAKREWSPLTVQLFAQNGFAVLELDNRGSGNRGRVFEAPIYRDMGSVEVQDQVLGLQALKNQPWADLQRVGVFGHSYGGYMTLMCLCQAAEHFQAGVAVAPVADWQLYDSHYTERYMGLPEDNVAGYKRANVLSHLANLTGSLLLMHGMADDNVLFTHSTMIMAELQAQGKPFELMTYPGAKHGMQERDVSIHRFNMILDFFNRRLNAS